MQQHQIIHLTYLQCHTLMIMNSRTGANSIIQRYFDHVIVSNYGPYPQ